ncbi:MAG: copper amine oxidase-like protein [Chthonomonadales bacterium]|nr:copper amine oxidase-like protein [Chthonomonadales bacterium]
MNQSKGLSIPIPRRKRSIPISGIFARSALSLGVLLTLSAGSVQAQQINVTVNGSPVAFTGVGPLQVQGRTLVPVRGVLEKLGAKVAWVPSTRSVIASTPSMDIELHLGDRQATVNGKSVTLDVPAQEIEGSTMVPLRFLGEALGGVVKWDDATRTVTIVTNGDTDSEGPNPPGRDRQNGDRPDRPRRDRSNGDSPDRPIRDRSNGDNPDRPVRDRSNGNNPDQPGQNRPNRDAQGPNRPNSAEPKITALVFKADDWYGWVQAGHNVRVEMTGTPNADATFRIPGVTEAVPMKEGEPGKYMANWKVPMKDVQLKDASIIGELKIGDRSAATMQAVGRLSLDSKPPTILDRLPESEARVTSDRPNISAVFEDAGSGIWPPSMRLVVNGRDVSKEAKVTANFVSYTPSEPLPPGETRVVLTIDDKTTNTSRVEWKFDVVAGNANAGIRSVKENAGKTLEPGDVLHVEMEGVRGGAATFSLGNIKDVRLTEGPAGHYATDYTIRKGDDVQNATLATHLTLSDGQKFTRQSERAVSVTTGKPIAPVIVYPNKNDAIDSPLVIRGKATPHTQVRVKVEYSSKVLGLLPVQGTASDTIVTTDRDGNWKTDPIESRNLLSNRNVDYTISATAISANAESSETTQYRFRLR